MIKMLVKQMRWEKNYTLRELERMTGVGHSTLSKIENEEVMPKVDTLCAIARGLGVPVTDLFVDNRGKK